MRVIIVAGVTTTILAVGIVAVGGFFLYRLARMGPGMGMIFRTGYGPLFRR